MNQQNDNNSISIKIPLNSLDLHSDKSPATQPTCLLSESNENKTPRKWTKEEDDKLKELIEKFGSKRWKLISDHLETRSPVQCLHRWTKILKPGLIKGPWSNSEDMKLEKWVKMHGPNKWSQCSKYVDGRIGKQCRERWYNILNPMVTKGNWSIIEDFMIMKLFKEYGSKWSKICTHFRNRSENSLKNRFYSTLRKIRLKMTKNNSIKDFDDVNCCYSQNENLLKFFDYAYSEVLKEYIEYVSINPSMRLKEKIFFVSELSSSVNNEDNLNINKEENVELNQNFSTNFPNINTEQFVQLIENNDNQLNHKNNNKYREIDIVRDNRLKNDYIVYDNIQLMKIYPSFLKNEELSKEIESSKFLIDKIDSMIQILIQSKHQLTLEMNSRLYEMTKKSNQN